MTKPSELLLGDKDLSNDDNFFVSFYLLEELDKRFIDKDMVIGDYLKEKKAQLLKEIDNFFDKLQYRKEDTFRQVDSFDLNKLKKKVEEIMK